MTLAAYLQLALVEPSELVLTYYRQTGKKH